MAKALSGQGTIACAADLPGIVLPCFFLDSAQQQPRMFETFAARIV
jgi:hypothetical protein